MSLSMIALSASSIAEFLSVLVELTASLAPTVLLGALLAGSFSLRRQLEALIQTPAPAHTRSNPPD